ncbi:MAG TPA: hypothetical protein VNC50_14840 [Planctomycetia bacterium]|nr:hypothetical protein [Planctomycetia bacterium]
MAKAKQPSPNPEVLRFLCSRCRKRIRAPLKLAGRFMECPLCKEKTSIPGSQAEADEDARDLSVQENYYEVPENCTKCGKKMKKGAVVCLKCGFDYKEGRQLTLVDHTVKEGEKTRGGPAFGFMCFDFVLLLIAAGIMVFRLLTGDRIWWEQGIYLTLVFMFLCFLPGHFMQWWNYRDLPIRDHPLVKEENRSEREETMKPLGDWTTGGILLCALLGFGLMFFVFSRDKEGKLLIPFTSQQQ